MQNLILAEFRKCSKSNGNQTVQKTLLVRAIIKFSFATLYTSIAFKGPREQK